MRSQQHTGATHDNWNHEPRTLCVRGFFVMENLQWDKARKGWSFTVRGAKSAVFFGESKAIAGAKYTYYRQRTQTSACLRRFPTRDSDWPYSAENFRLLTREPVISLVARYNNDRTAWTVYKDVVTVNGKDYTRTIRKIATTGMFRWYLNQMKAKRAPRKQMAGLN